MGLGIGALLEFIANLFTIIYMFIKDKIVLFVILLAILICGGAYYMRYIKPVNSTAANEINVEAYMEEYLTAMTKSINENNFSYVAQYVDGAAYAEQENYIKNYCPQRGIKEELQSVEVIHSENINENKIHVITNETYNISSNTSNLHVERFKTNYTLELISQEWKITEIYDIQSY